MQQVPILHRVLLAKLVFLLACFAVGCNNEIAPKQAPIQPVTGTATSTAGLMSTVTGTGGASAVAGSTSSVSTTGIQCQPGTVLCGTLCVDTQTSIENCGTCGAACPVGRVCAAGSCSSECVAPYTDCGGVCVDLTSDASNCGACAGQCELGKPCVGGVCGCPDGTLFCQGQCVDPESTAAHCGACDTACPTGGTCVDGACQCPVGTTLCGTACVSLSMAEHCGSCEQACAVGQICALGSCIAATEPCPGGTVLCGTGCVNTLSDPGNCGACGQACASSQACQNGSCGCANGQIECESGCVDATENPLHCGSCGATCTSGQTCRNGACGCTDPAATACGNECVTLANDPEHCGTCEVVCSDGLPCTDGECRCPDGQAPCNGACVSTDSDPTNCGACGMMCPEGETCIVGTCSGSVGDSCSSTLAGGISVTEVAVYQAGKVDVMRDGAAIGADGRDVDVVAGKNAVVRVFVSLEPGFTSRVLSARLSLLDGDELEQVFHKRTVTEASSDGNLATTFNIEVTGDLIRSTTRYAIEIVECDAASGTAASPRFPATGDEALEARDVGIVRVQFVPVVTNGIEASTDTEWLDLYRDFMAAMYPVSGVEYTVGETMEANAAVSANGSGWEQVLQQLAYRHQGDNAPNDLYYYGLMQPAGDLNQYCGQGCVAGIGYVPDAGTRSAHMRASIGISYGEGGSATTMAHEIGHNHGLPHAPCGGASDSDPGFPYQNAQIGWWGFVFPDTLVAGDQATDIMGYCNNQWISDYNYQNLLERVSVINSALSVINTNPSGHWRVVVTSAFGLSWGMSPQGESTAVGVPEGARVLDAAGNEVAQVTVYRASMDHLRGASIMVPEPEPGWHAIAIDGELALAYDSVDASVP